jgi:hypothetical protein
MRVFGNLMNRIAEDVKPHVPQVGMGCTILMYSDRHAATIVQVLSPNKIVIQEDTATRTDTNGMSEAQSYSYTANQNGAKHTVTLRKHGRWVMAGQSMRSGAVVRIGERSEYHDYSF